MALSPLQIKMIRRLLRSGAESKIAHAVEKIHPTDLTILFSELSEEETQKLINSLVLVAKAGKTIKELPEFMIPDILEVIEDKKLSEILSRLEPDDALFLLEKLPEERSQAILSRLPESQGQKLNRMRLYPPDSAGSIMTSSFISVKVDMTVEEAIQSLRTQPETHGIFYIYVVDEHNRLMGVQSLRTLVMSAPGTKVRDIMTQEVQAVPMTANQETVAQTVSQYNLLALPVVNPNRELLGVITVDDVIDIVQEEATEDMYHLAGLSEADRATTTVAVKVKKRYPWIVLSYLTAGISASVVGLFEDSIQQFVSLAVFMPIVSAVGGNGAIQSLTVITRAIALGELSFVKLYKAVFKEGLAGLIVGIICGLIMGGTAALWKHNIYFGLIVLVATVCTLFIGGLAGAFIPLLFRRLKFDPAVGTSVLVTMVTDFIGFFIFLGMATMLMRQLLHH